MTGHSLFNDIALVTIASATGLAGNNLAEVDLYFGIILKGVSILSFTLLIVIHFSKVKDLLFPKKEIPKRK
jgi:hypothetical protein